MPLGVEIPVSLEHEPERNLFHTPGGREGCHRLASALYAHVASDHILRPLYPPPNGAPSRYSAMSTCAPRAFELVKTVRANVTIDWTVRENVRAICGCW